MLLVASYIFYGAWDWRFLTLIFFSTCLDYWTGLYIHRSATQRQKKFFLSISLVANFALLGFFKYYNFFTDNFVELLHAIGISVVPPHLAIILPVGISFYTFQTVSYSVDIYRGRLEPTRNFGDFALFVSFFPQLVAGPIEKAHDLLPQILKKRELTLQGFYEGIYLTFWGLFMKLFAADNLAGIVDPVFAEQGPHDPTRVAIAALAFAMQIYCDFAGYSSIARGVARCMGFDLVLNFNAPYLAINPQDYWRRWHISLSSWLRDYLYVPMGGNRISGIITYRNLLLTMVLGGLWHGAAWTYVAFGAYHGSLLAIHRMIEKPLARVISPKSFIGRSVWYLICLAFYFSLVCIGYIFFRAHSLTQAVEMIGQLFTKRWTLSSESLGNLKVVLLYSAIPYSMQVLQFTTNSPLTMLKAPLVVRAAFYLICFYLLLIYGVDGSENFFYFQF